jgi:hypothetical protein
MSIRTVLWIAAFIVLLSAIAICMHVSTNNQEFSRYNVQWNGTSQLFSEIEDRGGISIVVTGNLESYEDALLLCIAPNRSFTGEEKIYYRSFLQRGSTLFIADEDGAANSLLEDLGSNIRIIPRNLSSVDMEFSDPRSVIAYVTGNDTLTANISSIVLNSPAFIEGGTPLMSSSLLSWVDSNGNLRIDSGEVLERSNVLVLEHVGEGRLYVLSDPSVFINGMETLDIRDNRKFIETLLASSPTLLIDQVHSRTSSGEGVIKMVNMVKNTMIIKISVISSTILAFAYLYWRRREGL